MERKPGVGKGRSDGVMECWWGEAPERPKVLDRALTFATLYYWQRLQTRRLVRRSLSPPVDLNGLSDQRELLCLALPDLKPKSA